MRKPRAKKTPETCAELVRDIDERLEGGDALSDVWLPHEDWAALVHASLDELEPSSTEANPTEVAPAKWSVRETFDRAALIKVLDCGVDSTWEDLIEVARGYVMALEAERASLLWQSLEIAAARVRRVPVASPPSEGGYAVKVGSLWAGWAGELVRESERLVVALASEAERIALAYSSDYPAAKAVQLKTLKRATVTEPAVTVDVELGAQAGGTELQAECAPGDPDCPSCGAGEEREPPECPTCGEADGHKPEDCAMREPEEQPKKKRSKRKAQAELLTEPAPGEASRRLRPNKVKMTDFEAEEGAPF
jgi:hypothetical protein